MRVWRICRERHVATAFSGDGARWFGARWNAAGVPVVYTSLSLSLAVVEMFVHLNVAVEPEDLVSIEAELPGDVLDAERVAIKDLPVDWRLVDHPALRAIGAEWVRSRRSLALLVPSVAVDGEWNALVNPEHPEARKIRVVETKPFRFDARMFRRNESLQP
jgi:RES domain-containing protein